MPPCASGPVFTVSRPSLNGAACAIAGAGNLNAAMAAPAAVPAINLRSVTLREMRVLLDKQYREAFLLQCADGFPKALDNDRRQSFRRFIHDQAVGVGHQ